MPNYIWLLRYLKKLLITYLLFIINVKLVEFNVISLVFLSMIIILYYWYVFKVIEAYVYRAGFILEDKDQEEFKLRFYSVINKKSYDSLVALWGTFRDKWVKKYPDVIQYLLDTWLYAGRKEAFYKVFFPETVYFEFFTTLP